MEEDTVLYLTMEDVRACNGEDASAARADVSKALAIHAGGETALPPKITLSPPFGEQEHSSHYVVMPAYVGGDVQMAGVKWVSVGQECDSSSIPAIPSLILLVNHGNGRPIAIMDGTLLTGIRTAAVTAVAAKALANPQAEVLGLIGAGFQSRMHLQSLMEVLPCLKEIRIYNRTHLKAQELAACYSTQFHGSIRAVRQAEAAVQGADVVVSATSSLTPIIQQAWLKEGVFYAQVGTHECTFEAVHDFNKIYVDDWEQILRRGVQTLAMMASHGQWDGSRLHGTLGDYLNGQISGRESASEKIMFSGIGLGVTDICMAERIYRTAVAKGIGNKLPLWGKGEIIRT
ncbi:hypothetical protein [Paenibacillus sp. SI8]|uniref:hypothetical protein n=1 Tax=unclassified Paenibacillus TaxID=185978 RepID=UPI0034651671